MAMDAIVIFPMPTEACPRKYSAKRNEQQKKIKTFIQQHFEACPDFALCQVSLVDFIENNGKYDFDGTRDPGYTILEPWLFNSDHSQVIVFIRINDFWDRPVDRLKQVTGVQEQDHKWVFGPTKTLNLVDYRLGHPILTNEEMFDQYAPRVIFDGYLDTDLLQINDGWVDEYLLESAMKEWEVKLRGLRESGQ